MLTRCARWLVLAALSTSIFGSREALAHVRLVDAAPSDGAVVDRPPERVLLHFSSGIESRQLKFSVTGPRGSSSLVIEGSGGAPASELSIPVPDQGRGKYVVRWELTGADGDRIRGALQFVVR